jgi:hypothetical protein
MVGKVTSDIVSINWKRIIQRVIEFCQRWGPYFFAATITLVAGIIPARHYLQNPTLDIIILAILATPCFVLTIIALYYDIKDARHRDYLRAILKPLRGYLADMNRLLYEFPRSIDHSSETKLARLEQRIAAFIKHKIPSELEYWNQPLADYAVIPDRIKRRIGMLEAIINKLEVSNTNHKLASSKAS